MTYKESLHRIWLIAKREVHRLVAQPIYFFCMLIAPAICVIFFVSLMHEIADRSADSSGGYG